MRRLAFAMMMCWLTLGASAQTAPPQVPPVSAQPQGYGGGKQPAQEPHATATPTIIVNVQPPSKTQAEATKEEAEREEKAGLDRRLVELTSDLATYTKWLAYATIILTGATAGLFAFAVLQARDAKEVGRAARESADAAKLSAESAIAAEGATVVVSMVSFEGGGAVGREDQVRRGVVQAHARNYGKSPAFLRKTCIEVFCGARLPDVPQYRDVVPVIDVVLETRQDHQLKSGRPVNGPLGDREVSEILAGKKALWAFGYVTYRDVFGAPRTHRFCRKVRVSKENGELIWVSTGPAAYTKSS